MALGDTFAVFVCCGVEELAALGADIVVVEVMPCDFIRYLYSSINFDAFGGVAVGRRVSFPGAIRLLLNADATIN